MSLLLVGDKLQEDAGGICLFHSSFLSIRNIAFHIVSTQSRIVDWINKGVIFLYPDIIKLLVCVCVCVLVTQSCPTLCYSIDCSPPGSSVHGILQARILDWFAVSFSLKLLTRRVLNHSFPHCALKQPKPVSHTPQALTDASAHTASLIPHQCLSLCSCRDSLCSLLTY